MFGGQNMQQMMKQAKKMQKQMEDEQSAIAQTDYVGHAPSDLVLETFSGDRELKDLQINADIVDPEDVDGLADMVLVAVNDALKQIEQDQQKRLGQFAPKGMF
jgi:DNA-binding YbaB/EbfC family protein